MLLQGQASIVRIRLTESDQQQGPRIQGTEEVSIGENHQVQSAVSFGLPLNAKGGRFLDLKSFDTLGKRRNISDGLALLRSADD